MRRAIPRAGAIGGWAVRLLAGLALAVVAACVLPPGKFGLALETTPEGEAPRADPYAALQRARLLADLGAERWHARQWRGRGVKVAVLDAGFRGYRDQLGKALPAQVAARSFRLDGDLEARDSQHGILCGEVIHALAPEAELLFVNWEPDCPEKFLEAVRWARREGARVLSCSLIMPGWSDGEGNGPVHAALAELLEEDAVCVACAGNTALRHWAGHFRPGRDGYHEWQPGQIDNRIEPWDDERVSVELCAPAGAGYEVVVQDAATEEEVGRARQGCQRERCCAEVRFVPRPLHRYQVRVRLAHGPAGPFHLVVLGGGLRYATVRGSISFPGDGPEVITVGAVDRDGRRLSYSSCGPNSPRPKPDLVAAVPFPSTWRGRPFTGTSAAAPQVAGLAALLWSRYPCWTAKELRRALTTWARDLGPPGHDDETGYGLVRLP